MDLLVFDIKEIADHTAVATVQNVQRIGLESFQAFIKECLLERSMSIDDVIYCNKLKKVFTSSPRKTESRKKAAADDLIKV
jgi:hypothetical protein